MFPVTYLLLLDEYKNITPLVIFGIFVWLAGLIIEAVADQQKFAFKNNPKNEGLWVDSGLWKYSGHPNYCGGIVLWLGVFVFVSLFLNSWSWLTIIQGVREGRSIASRFKLEPNPTCFLD